MLNQALQATLTTGFYHVVTPVWNSFVWDKTVQLTFHRTALIGNTMGLVIRPGWLLSIHPSLPQNLPHWERAKTSAPARCNRLRRISLGRTVMIVRGSEKKTSWPAWKLSANVALISSFVLRLSWECRNKQKQQWPGEHCRNACMGRHLSFYCSFFKAHIRTLCWTTWLHRVDNQIRLCTESESRTH